MSTSIRVGCDLNSPCENTLLFLSQCAWVSLISAMSRSAGRPWKPPSAPENCRYELSQQSHVPFPPSTAQSWWEQGFFGVGFQWALPSLLKSKLLQWAQHPQRLPQVSRALLSSCWQPGRAHSSALQPPPALPPGLCQPDGDTALGSTSRASFLCQRLIAALTRRHLGSFL